MNANELADALDTIGNKYLVILGDIEFKKAADFVRQQQTEIDALKKELYFKDYYEELPDTPVDLLRKAQEK
jgi:hypothetical protein